MVISHYLHKPKFLYLIMFIYAIIKKNLGLYFFEHPGFFNTIMVFITYLTSSISIIDYFTIHGFVVWDLKSSYFRRLIIRGFIDSAFISFRIQSRKLKYTFNLTSFWNFTSHHNVHMHCNKIFEIIWRFKFTNTLWLQKSLCYTFF